MDVKIPCSVCGGETDTPKGYHLRYNINFCTDKCMNEFVEEFMLMTFESMKDNEKKLALLERKMNTLFKTRKKRRK